VVFLAAGLLLLGMGDNPWAIFVDISIAKNLEKIRKIFVAQGIFVEGC
jgi:hypothetical protein